MPLTTTRCRQRVGPVGGFYADATRVGFVLHEIDELIHHGAEIALLRDLYRAARDRRPSVGVVAAALSVQRRADSDGCGRRKLGSVAAVVTRRRCGGYLA